MRRLRRITPQGADLRLSLRLLFQQFFADPYPQCLQQILPVLEQAPPDRRLRRDEDNGIILLPQKVQGLVGGHRFQGDDDLQRPPGQGLRQRLLRIKGQVFFPHCLADQVAQVFGRLCLALRRIQAGTGHLLNLLDQNHLFGDDQPVVDLVHEPGLLADLLQRPTQVVDVHPRAQVAQEDLVFGRPGNPHR
ncbi:MAG: hypothetical protein ACK4WK_07440 [Anaerolineae bacterium]